ncbi:oligosaccharide flippase family protein [Methanofollis fontis]|uniref:oligosaccharide flippase family protein n=1 Tax=Methanofollis fontis TaxID=2052832 RepID=UPI0013EEC93B|nr:oligosaccharide flippase family protein [Methanofollis fontis]
MPNSPEDDENYSRQVPRNLLSYFAVSLTNLVVGFWLTPFYVQSLGVAAYGLIPLATSITNYFGIITESIHTTVSRYLTVDLRTNNFKKANITFNTAIFGALGLILIITPIAAILSFNVESIFSIPEGIADDAMVMFLGIISAFLLNAWASNFGVPLFSHNRLDLKNLIVVVRYLSQVIIVVALFFILSPSIRYIGVSFFIAAIIAFVITLLLWKWIAPQLKVKPRDFNIQRLKDLSGLGGWYLVTVAGSLLFTQIDLIVINLSLDPVAGGEYAIALTWSLLLRSMASMFDGVVGPVIMIDYAREKFDSILRISKTAVKCMGYIIALPVGLISGFAPQLLTLWVGPEFAGLAPLMWILIGHLVINLAVRPLFPIEVAFNKVRTPGLITLGMGICNLLLAVFLVNFTALGMYGVAIAGAIMLTMKNSIFTPWYAARIMGVSSTTFVRPLVSGLVAVIIIASSLYILHFWISITSWIQLGACSAIVGLAYTGMIWRFGLSLQERKVILSLVPSPIQQKISFLA